jgi:crossover junction endodeoxyribonuclease RuvC
MKILGIDPGFAFVGIVIIEFNPTSTRILLHETFETKPRDEDHGRLDAICDRICDVIEQWQPDAIGYENQQGVEVAAQRARDEGDIGSNAASRRVHEVVGIIRAAARFYGTPCYVSAVNTVKVAVLGKGGSRKSKAAVKTAVQTIFHIGRCSEHVAHAVGVAIATRRKHREAQLIIQSAAHVIH